MHKVSYVLAERYSQDPLETYFSFSCFFWGAFKNDVTGVGGGGYMQIVISPPKKVMYKFKIDLV